MRNRNNKKGFTLVELIAVIVVLGVLLLIAIPSVSKIIETSSKNAYLDATKMAVNAVMTEADLELSDGGFNVGTDDHSCIYNFYDLKMSSGKLDGTGYVLVTEKVSGNPAKGYWYYVYATNGKYHFENMDMTSELVLNETNSESFPANMYAPKDEGGGDTGYKTTCTSEVSYKSVIATLSGETTTPSEPTPAISTYTVTFLVDGSPYDTQEVIDNNRVSQPADPTKNGAIFDGWKLPGDTAKFNFTTTITSDITLIASWKDNSLYSGSCSQYGILKIKNPDGTFEEYWVVDEGRITGNVLLFSRYGLGANNKLSTGQGSLVLYTGLNNALNSYENYIRNTLKINLVTFSSLTSDTVQYLCDTFPFYTRSTTLKFSECSSPKAKEILIPPNPQEGKTFTNISQYSYTPSDNYGYTYFYHRPNYSDYFDNQISFTAINTDNQYTRYSFFIRPQLRIARSDIPICT